MSDFIDLTDAATGRDEGPRPRGVLVTGTDTGVGKTVVSAVLCSLLDAAYVKPVQSGADDGDDDAGLVARLVGVPTVVGATLGPSLAPAVAARQAGVTVEGSQLAGVVRTAAAVHLDRPLVVEGAGGLLVELGTDGTTIADLAQELRLPLVIVARPGLGTLNHTLLTLEACDRRRLPVAGVVVSGMPAQVSGAAAADRSRPPVDEATRTNLAELWRLTGGRLAGVVPTLSMDGPIDELAARAWLAPGLGGLWRPPFEGPPGHDLRDLDDPEG